MSYYNGKKIMTVVESIGLVGVPISVPFNIDIENGTASGTIEEKYYSEIATTIENGKIPYLYDSGSFCYFYPFSVEDLTDVEFLFQDSLNKLLYILVLNVLTGEWRVVKCNSLRTFFSDSLNGTGDVSTLIGKQTSKLYKLNPLIDLINIKNGVFNSVTYDNLIFYSVGKRGNIYLYCCNVGTFNIFIELTYLGKGVVSEDANTYEITNAVLVESMTETKVQELIDSSITSAINADY